MRFRLLAILVSLGSAILARSNFHDAAKVVESLHSTPQGWTQLGRAGPDTRLHLKIALHMSDHNLFEQTLLSVSSPENADYGRHLTRDQVKALIKPRDTSTSAVLSWLEVFGIPASDIDHDGEWINVNLPVTEAEEILATQFYYFAQNVGKTQNQIIRTLQYSLPLIIAPHISTIQPTTRFAQLRAQKTGVFKAEYFRKLTTTTAAGNVISPSCNITITPDCLRSLYNIGNYTANPMVGSHFGVCGYLKQYAKYKTLDRFLNRYAKLAVSQNFTYQLINGGLSTQKDFDDDDFEANLDIQYAASLGYKQNITYYSTGGLGLLLPDLDQPTPQSNQNEPYLEFLTYILNLPDKDLPQTLTSSYAENEQSVPAAYAKHVCDMFGQLGLRGVSVIFSSGDSGPGSACRTNDGKNTTRFLPIFPAACPYVTSVGGTYGIFPEKAVDFSSGGFSDIFKRPGYQDNAVKHYLDYLGNEWNGLYNPHGRGFPDVATQGRRASSPTFAAIVSLLNNARIAAGKKPLGFLNPWLYSHGKENLTDITVGRSAWCTGVDEFSGLETPDVSGAGWNATKCWDAVTGLGTPDFGKMLELMKTHR